MSCELVSPKFDNSSLEMILRWKLGSVADCSGVHSANIRCCLWSLTFCSWVSWMLYGCKPKLWSAKGLVLFSADLEFHRRTSVANSSLGRAIMATVKWAKRPNRKPIMKKQFYYLQVWWMLYPSLVIWQNRLNTWQLIWQMYFQQDGHYQLSKFLLEDPFETLIIIETIQLKTSLIFLWYWLKETANMSKYWWYAIIKLIVFFACNCLN